MAQFNLKNTWRKFADGLKAFKYDGFAPGMDLPGWFQNSFLKLQGENYRTPPDRLWHNSAVWVCLNWLALSLPDAPPQVSKVNPKSGVETPVVGHPLIALLKKPNKWYSGRALMAATVISMMTDGNAYWHKVRDRSGKVIELWYIPHWLMIPRWPLDGSEFISHYDYTVNGRTVEVLPSEVVHLRYLVDPENVRKGKGPLRPVYQEVLSDDEGTNYTLSLLTNMGIPGVVISPDVDGNGRDIDFDPETIIKTFKAKTRGSKRGEPVVIPIRFKMENLGFSPEQLALDKIREYPEARICAALQIPAQVVGLSVGQDQKTYANYFQARRAAWEDCVLPLLAMIDEEIDNQLLSEDFADAGEGLVMGRNLAKVRALMEDLDALYKRAVLAFKGGVLKRSESRALLGLKSKAGVEDKFVEEYAPAPPDIVDPAEGDPGAGEGGTGGKALQKSEAGANLTGWAERCLREIAALTEEIA